MPKSADRNFMEMMKQGWIAGYPPWFHNFWIQHSACKTEEEKTHLLEFLRAIEDGKPSEAKRLLAGIDLNLQLAVHGPRTESLLEWAVEKARDADCVRLLLKSGASVKAPWLIYKAVNRGDNQILAELLEAGADPNSGSKEENSLTSACWRKC
jgi:hypothetical protein